MSAGKPTGLRTIGSLRLMCEHPTNRNGSPPIPTLIRIRIDGARRRASRPLCAGEVQAAALAMANRNRLRHRVLNTAAGGAALGKRHGVDRAPAHEGNAPQQRLPELKSALAPVGEAARAPTRAGARDDGSTSRREKRAPRQERVQVRVRKTGPAPRTRQRNAQRATRDRQRGHCRSRGNRRDENEAIENRQEGGVGPRRRAHRRC